MVYRINWRNFLLHMIDWFDYTDFVNMWWFVLSYEIASNGTSSRVWKVSSSTGGLFPPGSICDYYDETHDYETAKSMYFDYLMKRDNETDIPVAIADIYKRIVAPMKRYSNVCIIYTVEETWIANAFCEFIKNMFAIDVIDLDHLFKHGWVKGFYLDRELIREKSSDIEIQAQLLDIQDKLKTAEGRAELAAKMSRKDKIKKLKDLGIKATKYDDVDRLLNEAWVQSE